MFLPSPTLSAILYLLIGLAAGSFLSVLWVRLPKGRSLLGRSECDQCKAVLRIEDLLPVVSYFLSRGRCRFCGHKISPFYPWMELLTGLLFLLAGFWSGVDLVGILVVGDWSFAVWGVFLLGVVWVTIFLLFTVFLFDLRRGVIPRDLVNLGVVLSLFMLLFPLLRVFLLESDLLFLGRFEGLTPLFPTLILTVGLSSLAYLFFSFLNRATHGKGLGEGDAKLVFWLGLLSPFPDFLLALLISFWLGALTALGLVIAGKKRFGETLPLAPFLILGTVTIVVFGGEIWPWFLLFALSR